jgi:hypothetical protein
MKKQFSKLSMIAPVNDKTEKNETAAENGVTEL